MLLINDKGNIIGYNKTLDTKPAPFVSKTATWTGSDWQYNDTKECVPDFFNMNAIDCFQLHSYIMSLISPEPGIKVKEKSKDITVLIPSFGKKEYVNYAIDSAKNQTLKPYDIIVLDMDNSVSRDDITVIKSERLNPSQARNKLVDLCKTDYFVFLDADDLLCSTFLDSMYHDKASVVGCATKCIDEYGKFISNAKYKGFHKRPFSAACFNLTGLLHKEVWKEVGGLREDLAFGGEDSYFWCEIFKQKKWLVSFNDTAFLYYRVCNGQISKKETFIKSKELELYLHKDFYRNCLLDNNEKDLHYLQWTLKWKPFALMILTQFEALWQYRTDDILKIIPACKSLKLQSSIYNEINWYKQYYSLLDESKKRDTSFVYYGDIPSLYGRKFDLAIFDYPRPDIKDSFYVLLNTNIDINMPVEKLLQQYNVVFINSITNFVFEMQQNFNTHILEDMKASYIF